MDIDLVFKLGFGLVSSLGTIALVYYNFGQAKKLRADLLEQFDQAVARKSVHSVTELFRLIHGLRMSYCDITSLIQHDQCSKIIYALKKTPKMVSYSNGDFKYSAGTTVFRFIDAFINKVGLLLFASLTMLSLSLFVFGESSTSFLGFVFLLISSIMFALQIRQRDFNQMIRNLVSVEN